MEKSLEYPPEQTVKVWKNGVDVHISVENVKTAITIDKNESLDCTSESLPESSPGGIAEECDEKSCEYVQEEKRPN